LLDCDGDSVIYKVEQKGNIACHTGHRSCFYRSWDGKDWKENAPVLKSPEEMYGKEHH
jgi:phosphoribosyl-AMP cyclohydrolase